MADKRLFDTRAQKRQDAPRTGMAHVIEIVTTGGIAFQIDATDADLCNFSWGLSGDGYIRVNHRQAGKLKTIRLHRVVLGRILGRELTSDEIVDHIDLNPLNNRRSNLRLATKSQNQCNARARKNNTSGYKGVYRSRTKWKAQIKVRNQVYHLGMFDTPEEAFEAYKVGALKYHGEFARTE